ncbi:hypothetical protein O6H91_11G111300 [Diphasiastrum complanatum]|uniref:Uncharacterized protein n=1 Tax=Diphasiastrum complanatum TaxID=34168 RepID=A0ACC2CDU9_DIPCM|nr:hypothetical protein O6H91_Y009000 [Diphasiastrum complanatum]KAJ7539837.1 hypothetical protein O6H91_11G111300 [Diphasiastrum complanatum]
MSALLLPACKSPYLTTTITLIPACPSLPLICSLPADLLPSLSVLSTLRPSSLPVIKTLLSTCVGRAPFLLPICIQSLLLPKGYRSLPLWRLLSFFATLLIALNLSGAYYHPCLWTCCEPCPLLAPIFLFSCSPLLICDFCSLSTHPRACPWVCICSLPAVCVARCLSCSVSGPICPACLCTVRTLTTSLSYPSPVSKALYCL